MKINKIQNQYLDTSTYKAKEDKSKNINIKKEDAVKIEISSSAKELVKKINQTDDSKYSDKVENIRMSIKQGKYKVSSEEIADKILKTIESQKGSEKL